MECSTQEQINKKLATFLIEQKASIVEKWLEHVLLPQNDPFYEEVKKNGYQTILELINYLETGSLDRLNKLTNKMATERIEAKADIGDFVHNINIGRSVVYELLMCSLLNEHEKGKGVLMMQRYFDHLLYLSVKDYTALKDSIIEKKNQFIQEMHHDRLTMLGQIAASFAHEFRNPLTSVKGFIYLLQRELEKTEQSDHYFDIIKNEMQSLEEKITQFLYLSKMRGLEDKLVHVPIKTLIEEMIEFMYPRFTETNIIIHADLDEEVMIEGDSSQIKQVLLNILVNAVEELSEWNGERKIEVKLRRMEDKAELSICNNGNPIPDYLLENVFEPFVTTKSLGTGLGLSVCKQIVEKHNGTIEVSSEEDITCFTIMFPTL
ncbi:histidine kinase N-terminal domain-containing protein [Fictibacillus phosphorivorans]|uniref:histidine kinase N-terminal domain-containing protein n=1 Tax=Fictibacillus phosphorivorans TaxID=1221500 RepID=UPI002040A19A|nr:histidine kinase N-terminal domain-containing protein [Fictibacillus phosphorivorans]MCM3719081.1 ATP-binding protein [Fictibacillus phosphorivorans]MCM3776703.1 ATP-binding protein [Fictibacillus phosphorivorans]